MNIGIESRVDAQERGNVDIINMEEKLDRLIKHNII